MKKLICLGLIVILISGLTFGAWEIFNLTQNLETARNQIISLEQEKDILLAEKESLLVEKKNLGIQLEELREKIDILLAKNAEITEKIEKLEKELTPPWLDEVTAEISALQVYQALKALGAGPIYLADSKYSATTIKEWQKFIDGLIEK